MGRAVPVGLLLSVWAPCGAVLAAVAVFAWGWPEQLRALVEAMQRGYGVPSPVPAWLRADAHLHVVVTACATLWLGVGCRLFAPRALPWLPILLMVLIAVSDELVQLGVPGRTFEWSDQLADLVGMLIAVPALLVLPRLAVDRVPPAHRS